MPELMTNSNHLRDAGGCIQMLDARHPVAIFANGFGDCLICLPALRAAASLFAGRLTLVCPPGIARLFFSDLPLGVVCGCEMRQVPNGRAFDADELSKRLMGCDLLLSFNSTWHSPDVDRLLSLLSPDASIGFFPDFQVVLPRVPDKHSADLVFDVPRHLKPLLRLEDFAAPPVFPSKAHQLARQMRALVPAGARVLIVHADTKPEKMWPAERLRAALDEFLERHPDFITFVVGSNRLPLDTGRHGKRVFLCYDLPLPVSLALVGEADLFLGVDSCMLHAADLFRVPGVGLFGPTSCDEWGFRIGPHSHLCGDGKRIEHIGVPAVLDALESLLANTREARVPLDSGGARSRYGNIVT